MCHCEARFGSLAIPVVKIAPQQPTSKINNGKASDSIELCLNLSLRRIPVCPRGSGTDIIISAPLGQLLCGLPLEGGWYRLQTFVYAAAKSHQMHVTSRDGHRLRGGGDSNDGGAREGKLD